MAHGLNDRQLKFCQNYLKDPNGEKAAIKAGFSKKTARSKASQLLTKVNIQEYLDKFRTKAVEGTKVTVARILKEYTSIAYLGVKNIESTKKVNISDKIKSLDSLAKYLNMFESSEKNQATIINVINKIPKVTKTKAEWLNDG